MNKIKQLLIWAFGGAYLGETDAEFTRRIILSAIGTVLAFVLGAVLLWAGLVMGMAL